MFSKSFDVELLSDLSLTADAATVGKHTCLDYIPGSAFLGAAVAEALRRGENGGKFDADFFLSGRLRFSDALPTADGKSTYPMPRIFNKEKKSTGGNAANETKEKKAYNLLLKQEKHEGIQLQPWKNGYMTEDGFVCAVALNSNIKTAIDRKKGRAEDEKLFETESICSGQVFRMRITAEDENDLNRAENLILGTLYLGRSRTAEFGKVNIRISETPSVKDNYEQALSAEGSFVHIFLASDLMLKRDGQPTLVPEAADFGLKNAEIVWNRTSISSKNVSPWNSYFNRRMEERQLIAKGGVITFQFNPEKELTKDDLAALRDKLSGGVGLCREEGLGEVLVNPKWLIETSHLKEYKPQKVEKMVKEANTPLAHYLSRKSETIRYSTEAYSIGQKWAEKWKKAFYANPQNAPTKSQWGTIRGMANIYKEDKDKILRELEAFCKDGLRKGLWEVRSRDKKTIMYDAMTADLKNIVNAEEKHDWKFACIALYHAASAMQKMIDKER